MSLVDISLVLWDLQEAEGSAKALTSREPKSLEVSFSQKVHRAFWSWILVQNGCLVARNDGL